VKEGQTLTISLPQLRAIQQDRTADTHLPPPVSRRATPPPVPQVPASPPLNTVLAERYRLEERIGEGGMGRVYRVEHLSLGKSFALKLMRAEISHDSKLREQFYREARLASSMAHPNIVSIVDFGEDARWGAFMVMELLSGELLTWRLHRHKVLPIKVVCDVALQLADALHYIHKQNVVHGDIKPDNVLCCRLASSERRKWHVKLLDFGLANIRSTVATRATTVAGTPEYLAPERIAGEPPSPAMDVYSLGIVMYELITGAPPFRGALELILQGHLHTTPPPVSSLLDEPVDERLEELIKRALAKDPRDRQRNMEAFLYELRTVMDMLGYGRRNRSKPIRKQKDVELDRRHDAKARGFDASPLPMAIIAADGTIHVANESFGVFLTGKENSAVEGTSLLQTGFIELHPPLVSDMRQVQMTGMTRRAKLRLASDDGRPVEILLWIVPLGEPGGEVLLTIHAVVTSKR
jgi:serine/threonine protein kinase